MCKPCEANGDFADSEVRFGSPTHLRQYLDKKRNGRREALKEHEVPGAGSKGGGSGGALSEKDAGSIIACMDGVRLFTSKMVRFLIDISNNQWFRTCLRPSSTPVLRKVRREINKQITSRRDPRPFLQGIIFASLSW